MKNKKVVLVGAGVVNLVNAYFLARRGYELVLIDKAPPPTDQQNWKRLGCTFGGENVRMYSYTEADNYNEKGSQLYSRMDKAFSTVIDDGGWLTKAPSTFSDLERAWIEDFHNVGARGAMRFMEDIYRINIASGDLWERWMQTHPALFEHAEVCKDIFRIYSDPTDFEAAQQLHGRLGSITRVFAKEEVLQTYPMFRAASQAGQLGGCMLVKGFTLKVHTLCKAILKYLLARGVEVRWNSCFSGIEKDQFGKVTGILVDGELETYAHYVLSLGAYAGTTLLNTQTHNQLHGVLGVWLTLPNLYPELKHSMKIHKTGHVGEDTNVTLIQQNGQPVLVLGSGYGYTGNANHNSVQHEALTGLYDSLKETAKVYFSEAYAQALPKLDEGQKYCVRSWTPTGLGIFETIPTQNGGKLIITGGNNTGGFTQAPQISEAVLHALDDRVHPIHAEFHPQRMKRTAKSIN